MKHEEVEQFGFFINALDIRRKAGDLLSMCAERADVLWTDPPYGVDYTGMTTGTLTLLGDIDEVF